SSDVWSSDLGASRVSSSRGEKRWSRGSCQAHAWVASAMVSTTATNGKRHQLPYRISLPGRPPPVHAGCPPDGGVLSSFNGPTAIRCTARIRGGGRGITGL